MIVSNFTLPYQNQHRRNRIILYIFSGLMTIFFLLTAEFYFAGGAGSFLQTAQTIAAGGQTQAGLQRDIGYSLLLIATGYTITGSLKGIIIFQALVAFITPLIVYKAIGRDHPRIALFAGIITILSLIPYQLIKMIYHDQAFILFMLVFAWVYLLYSRSRNPGWLYALTLIGLAASFTRPAGNFLFPVIMLSVLLIHPRHWLHCLICSMFFGLLAYANYEYRRDLMGLKPGETMPGYTGQQIFYNLFAQSREWGVSITPETGPAVAEMIEMLKKEFSPDPSKHPRVEFYRIVAPEFATAFDFHDPDEFIKHAFEYPYFEYYIVFHTVGRLSNNSDLFMRASWDVMKRYPWYMPAYTARSMVYYFFFPGVTHIRMKKEWVMGRSDPEYYPFINSIAHEEGLTEKATSELETASLSDFSRKWAYMGRRVHTWWKSWYREINATVSTLMCIGGLFVVAERWQRRRPDFLRKWRFNYGDELLGLILLSLYNAAVTAATVDPNYRYQYMDMCVHIVCAALVLCQIADWMKKKPAY